jgi:enoyl-[acyl-carrier-protein] reductase (NADH)
VLPLRCAKGAWGEASIRYDERKVKLTPLTTLTFYLTPSAVFESVARLARSVAFSTSLEEANRALHELGVKTELDLERERHPRQLAVEAGPHGITVNAICPGFIVTDGTRELAAAGKLEEVRRRTPYRRLGTPEDVAGCAVFLASADSEFITGQNLVVDGGASIAG